MPGQVIVSMAEIAESTKENLYPVHPGDALLLYLLLHRLWYILLRAYRLDDYLRRLRSILAVAFHAADVRGSSP